MTSTSERSENQPVRSSAHNPYRKWLLLRRVTQYVALAAFVVLVFMARANRWDASLINIYVRLDPLSMIMPMIASRVFVAGSWAALLTIFLTLLFGRAWCGWLCPLGTVLDLLPFRHNRLHRAAAPDNLRKIKYYVLAAMLVGALFGNLTLLVLDPITLFLRSLTLSIWPALDAGFTALEFSLYPIPLFSGAIAQLDALMRPLVFPVNPIYVRDAMLYALVFTAVIALNYVASRFWCRYICPLGGLLGLLSKLALFRRQVDGTCIQCKRCARECPTQAIEGQGGFASDPAECTLCMDCFELCPSTSIHLKPTIKAAAWQQYDPGRRDVLVSSLAAIAALALFRADSHARRQHPFLLRPPGADNERILSRCVRCGKCMAACPTGVLQPATNEAGLEGFWTPVLLNRLGYCDYSCNSCGQVCPVEAIPPLSLEQKRNQVIGKAYIDENRCIAWADHHGCIVCEEMCPVSDKAIKLEERMVNLVEGGMVTVMVPHVIRERCIGCGICEYKCPVNGDAAIRVYAANDVLLR